MPLITIIIGTRPEAIKLAPVIKAFSDSKNFNVRIVLTGQHQEMVYQVLELFNINANYDLKLMSHDQTLTHITCSSLIGLEEECFTVSRLKLFKLSIIFSDLYESSRWKLC